MTPDQRRSSILDAVLPLVLESGPQLSTREIAAASGVAEGTIFRVFDSKSDLINAAICRALTPTNLLTELGSLTDAADPAPPLPELTEAIVAGLREHARNTHRLMGQLARPDGAGPPPDSPGPHGRDVGRAVVSAVAELLEPYSSELAATPLTSTGAIVALSYGSLLAEPAPTAPEIAQIALHGITSTDGRQPC